MICIYCNSLSVYWNYKITKNGSVTDPPFLILLITLNREIIFLHVLCKLLAENVRPIHAIWDQVKAD